MMSDQRMPAGEPGNDDVSAFEELLSTASQRPPQTAPAAPGSGAFATVFRGYDKAEVDDAISELRVRVRTESERAASFEERYRRVHEVADAQTTDLLQRVEAERDAAVEAAQAELAELKAAQAESTADMEAQLVAANAKAASAEQKVEALTEELLGAGGESANRHRFEEILRVAEEQASVLIRNASVQGDRLLEAAREEIENRRKEVRAEVDSILAQAEHDAQQVRLRIDTELTAHKAQLEREAAHAAEKVSQAEQEAAAIRTEAEKGAAALRTMVTRETTQDRAEAEEAVRELRLRALDFEESLTRRQDDAQQEFLMLHNQAVAHAERITQDANDQVAASVDHAQRVSAKAEDFERLMRAQAQQIEAEAQVRAREQLDRARVKAQKIIDTVTVHSESVLRDAEDRTRQLRWQQHQLTSFMAEVKELIRPEVRAEGEEKTDAAAEPRDATDDELQELLAGSIADEADDAEETDAAADADADVDDAEAAAEDEDEDDADADDAEAQAEAKPESVES
jgi:hypothetical protein